VVLTLVSLLLAAEPAKELSILTTGRFHGAEVKGVPTEGWLDLTDDKLVPVKVKLTKIRDEVLDEGKPASVKTGIEISTGPLPPIVLIRGLEPGAVKSARMERKRSLGDGKPVKAGDASLLAVTKGKVQQLVLTQGAKTQVLYEQLDGDLDGWELRWAGDLDADGKLDLLIQADEHYNLKTTRLFLSTHAKDGELMREVAKFSTSGC
jgi:hypothetical protein